MIGKKSLSYLSFKVPVPLDVISQSVSQYERLYVFQYVVQCAVIRKLQYGHTPCNAYTPNPDAYASTTLQMHL